MIPAVPAEVQDIAMSVAVTALTEPGLMRERFINAIPAAGQGHVRYAMAAEWFVKIFRIPEACETVQEDRRYPIFQTGYRQKTYLCTVKNLLPAKAHDSCRMYRKSTQKFLWVPEQCSRLHPHKCHTVS